MRRRGKWKPHFRGGPPSTCWDHEWLKAAMDNQIVVSLDNVAQYFYENWDKGWSFEDFPNLSPPFEVCFFEWQVPRIQSFLSNHKVKELTDDFASRLQEWNARVVDLPQSFGVLMTAMDIQGHEDYEWATDRDMDARWELTLLMFAELGGVTSGPFGLLTLLINGNGSVSRGRSGGPLILVHVPEEHSFPNEEVEKMFLNQWTSHIFPLFLGLSLMHCKNVKRVSQEPPRPLQRKSQRTYGHALTKYYTLEIEPMKQVLETQGGAARTGLRGALHICRGHFATYSPVKPLFGKYAGTFWKPQHLRGTKKHGEVVKDYSVNAPKGRGEGD